MSYNKKNYIVRDSKDNFYEFYLNDGKLTLKNSSIGQTIFKENVLEYAVDIDKDDKIHIVYFDKEGRLNYSLYYKEKLIEENTFLINKGYKVTLINIKIIYSKLHIFYQAYNCSKGKTAIYHSYLSVGKWIDETIVEINCPKYVSSYFIDYYNEYIYTLYLKDYNSGEYNIKKFNGKIEKWEEFEDTFAIKGATNLSIFVLPSKIVMICFNKLVNHNIQAMVIYKDLNIKNSLWSKEINISDNNKNAVKPIVFYSKDNIYVTWKQGNSIAYKKSTDLLTWTREFIIDTDLEREFNLMFISSNFKHSNLKINRTYMLHAEFIFSPINSKSYYSCDSLTCNSTSKDTELSLQTNDNESKKYKDNYIKKLLSEIEAKDWTIKHVKELNLRLKDEVNILNNLIHDYEDKLQNIKNKQVLNSKAYSQVINKYEKELKLLEEEKNKLFINTNEKVETLLKVIEEKDIIIQKLYRIIKGEK
jgi:hypothetical protein